MKIRIETTIAAPIDTVWKAYTTPEDIIHWNAASDDWHTPSATVDLRVGGRFCSRMEAKDGSFGFDFSGVYTTVTKNSLMEYTFGERVARIEFYDEGKTVSVKIEFDAEGENSFELQQKGWQAILDNFKRYVERLQ